MNFQNKTAIIDDQSEPGSWARAIKDNPVNIILEERGEKYGVYSELALVSQNIKSAMSHSRNWKHLPADMRESLEMVASKIARLLNGDWNYTDNLVDAIGYLQLVLDRLERGQDRTLDVNGNYQTENGS